MHLTITPPGVFQKRHRKYPATYGGDNSLANRRHDTANLTAKIIIEWNLAFPNSPARLRTAPGAVQNYRPTADTSDARRSRRSSANRILTILKAALNVAYRNEKIVGYNEWRRVRHFAKADAPRLLSLRDGESRRLVSACNPNFRPMVMAALFIGARYSDLAALEVRCFDPQSRSLWLRDTKSGTPRALYFEGEGFRLVSEAIVGKIRTEMIFPRPDGRRWGAAHQTRPMQAACKAAGLKHVSFHDLRRTYLSKASKERRSHGSDRRGAGPCRRPDYPQTLCSLGTVLCGGCHTKGRCGAGYDVTTDLASFADVSLLSPSITKLRHGAAPSESAPSIVQQTQPLAVRCDVGFVAGLEALYRNFGQRHGIASCVEAQALDFDMHKIVGPVRNIEALSGINDAQTWEKTAILSRCSGMLGNVQMVTPTTLEVKSQAISGRPKSSVSLAIFVVNRSRSVALNCAKSHH